jgi:hypothetical protein
LFATPKSKGKEKGEKWVNDLFTRKKMTNIQMDVEKSA